MIDRDASNRTVEITYLGFIDSSTIDDRVVVMLMMKRIKVSSIRTMEDSCCWIQTRVVIMMR
ncbi:unnamed protein product [Arabis nemorensis]|uniref:Uncharacterized protein n=1 Tax=Arabis nemorensis TaxID=586526 RepID=A0A565CM54_9BRAS|nr:unnamed protein product [Arabis nemorensis]